jgi:xanthine dehydrogenase accessory factor
VVMTANIDADIRALSGLAEGPYPYLGVMGAPAKLNRIRAELTKMGITEDRIDRFYAPVGLDMTSNTPEEIAVSIAAEILRLRKVLFPFTDSPAI